MVTLFCTAQFPVLGSQAPPGFNMQAADPDAPASPSGGSPIYKPSENPVLKGEADSGYTSQENIVKMDAEEMDTGKGHVSPPVTPTKETKHLQETSNSSTSGSSPSKSFVNDVIAASRLAKSSSTASNGSAKSVTVIGSTPLGRLRVHRVPSYAESSKTFITAKSDISDDTTLATPNASHSYPNREPPKCLETGDCFLLLDLPKKFTIGLDTIALTADGNNFLGFRGIPVGPHFLWISEPGAIARCGYWFVTKEQGEVRIKQWDRYNEMLGEAASHFEVRENRNNIDKTYQRLIPHNFKGDGTQTISLPTPTSPGPQSPGQSQGRRGSIPDPDFTTDSLTIWDKLVSAITPSFLDRVTGKKKVEEWLVDTADGAKGDIHFSESSKLLKSMAGSQLDFLFQQDIIDLQLLNVAAGDYSENDTTSRILAVLNNTHPTNKMPSQPSLSTESFNLTHTITESDILAEFQFTFLTGLHLGNYTCIEQWWHLLLKIILCAHQLVLLRPELVTSILQTFHAQMVYNDRYIDQAVDDPSTSTNPSSSAPATTTYTCNSVLDSIPRNKPKLRKALTVYKRHLNRALMSMKNNITPQQSAVGQAFADLEAWFWRFGWDLRSDYEEEDGQNADVNGDAMAKAKARMVLSDGDDSDEEMGEYAPVFVQLDEHGREVGLVNFGDD